MQKTYDDVIYDLASKTSIFEWSNHLNSESLQECLKALMEFVYIPSSSPGSVLNAKPGHGKTQALQLICYQNIQFKKKSSKLVSPLLIVLNEKKQQDNLEEIILRLLKQDNQKIEKGEFLSVNSDNIKYQNQHVKNAYIVVITHSRLLNLLTEFEDYGSDYSHFQHEAFFSWEEEDTSQIRPRKIIVDEAPPSFDGYSFGLDNMEWLNPLLKRYYLDSYPLTKEDKQELAATYYPREHEVSIEEQRIRNMIQKEHEYRQRYYEVVIRSAFQTALAKLFLDESGPYTRKLRDYISEDDYWYIERFFEHVESEKYEEIRDFNVISKYNWLKKLFYEDKVGMFDCESQRGNKKILCSRRLDYRIFDREIMIMDGTYGYSSLRYNNEYQSRIVNDYTKYNRVEVYCRNYATSASNRKKRKGKIQKVLADDIENLRLKNPKSEILPLMSKNDISLYRGLGTIKKEQRDYFEEKFHLNQLPVHLLNTRGKNFIADYGRLYLTSLPIRNPEYYKLQAISLHFNDHETLNFEMKEMYDDSKNWFLDNRIQNVYEEDLLGELIQIFHRTNLRKLNLSENSSVQIYIASRLGIFLKRLLANTPFKIYLDDRSDKETKLQAQAEDVLSGIIKHMKESSKHFPIRPGEVDRKTKKFLNTYYPSRLISEISQQERKKMNIIDNIFKKESLIVQFIETKTGKKERRINSIN